uniref:Uncharacterized protein n=1 Tax=Setaria viridis TaxID=4556 RepID=A0A4U6U9L4_SETVI|nr:hypothetical protein SEVIR_5G041300v2 [Setaria viridis]TKW12531.1 hypothetical protein SEVIR_5G041300v2 [Setaria viridis]
MNPQPTGATWLAAPAQRDTALTCSAAPLSPAAPSHSAPPAPALAARRRPAPPSQRGHAPAAQCRSAPTSRCRPDLQLGATPSPTMPAPRRTPPMLQVRRPRAALPRVGHDKESASSPTCKLPP